MAPYVNCKVLGPYTRKDGRKHVCVKFPNDKWRTVSYPKYLKEIELNHYLQNNETVDHIDKDFTNDNINNLQVLDRSIHVKLDCLRLKSQNFICPVCTKLFSLEGQRLHKAHNNRERRGSTGPYCSKSCAHKLSNVKSKIIKILICNKDTLKI